MNIDLEKLKAEEVAILVGVALPGQNKNELHENLEELRRLGETAGLSVEETVTQERDKIHPAYFIGSGKVEELRSLVQGRGVNVAVFDEELAPAQIRNLEKVLKIKIIDRSQLILDIFAKHARTREAKTQVELAQLQYLLPRLTRQWTHLSRQVGGIGTRGPGETQLETDRRMIRKRIEKLKKDLQVIDRQRVVQRNHRKAMFRVALIGYTNVGKSTLINLLSGSEVPVENQLFATLDSTIRKVRLNNHHSILLGDTVGFIRKLPHHLIASFKSTLDEVREADLLLQVVDISHPQFREQMQTVMSVLEELKAHRKPVIIVYNKIDQLKELGLLQSLKNQHDTVVFISARRHIGIDSLKKMLVSLLEEKYVSGKFTVSVKDQNFINFLHENALVEKQDYLDTRVSISFKCKRSLYPRVKSRYKKVHSDEVN